MSNPKVVTLQPDRKPAALPPIVNSLRQQARKQLMALLKALLDCTDDALFEMADRSQSNADHHLYFDSMRQIRLHRGDIEKQFVEEVNEGFERVFSAALQDEGVDGVHADDMSLLQNDDLEVSVAISGITSKITSQFSLPIMELTKRFDHLAKRNTVTERRNPLGPQAISEAFARATEAIDVDIKIRIILLKLFERMVMQRMGPIYEEANRALTDAGVLKDLRRTLTRGRNPQAGGVRPPAGGGAQSGNPTPHAAGRHGDGAGSLSGGHAGYGHGGYGQNSYGSAGGQSGYGSGGSAGGSDAGGSYAGSGGYGAAGAGGNGGGAAGYGSQAGAPGGYGADATGAGYGYEGGGHAGASGGELDIPGFEGFGTIQQLMAGSRGPESARLQSGSVIATPALIDLLNSVQTESGSEQFSVAEVPPVLDLRQMVVTRARDVTGEALNHLGRADEDVVNFIGMLFDYILNDRNLAIPMKALIARLQIPIVKLAIIDKSFFNRAAHPARQLLNELSSAGIGWSSAAELKRDAVYNKIESVVVRVLNGFSENPAIFQELLDELRTFRGQDTVRNARMEQRVKEKESGRARTLTAKQEVQKVINQKACGLRLPRDMGRFLSDVWSRVLVLVSLRDGVGSPLWEELMVTLDDLLWTVQPLDDMQQIEQRDEMRPQLLDRIEQGMALVQLAESDQHRWRAIIDSQLEEISRNDRSFLEDDDAERHADVFPEMEEIVLAAPHEVTDSYQGDAPAPDFVDKINRLAEGSWVEIHQEDAVLRCKLATIVKPGDRYVFVNRRGMKVAEKTRMELARELQDDKLVMLNDSQVFDRALQAVIGNLRQIQSQNR